MCLFDLQFLHLKKENGQVTAGDLPPLLVNLKPFNMIFKEEEIREILCEPGTDEGRKLDFETFLGVILGVPLFSRIHLSIY